MKRKQPPKDPMMDPTSIGNIAMTAFGITPMQLSRALRYKQDNPDMMLGEALVRLGLISRDDLDIAVERQQVLRADAEQVIDIAIARTRRVAESIEGLMAVQQRALLKLSK